MLALRCFSFCKRKVTTEIDSKRCWIATYLLNATSANRIPHFHHQAIYFFVRHPYILTRLGVQEPKNGVSKSWKKNNYNYKQQFRTCKHEYLFHLKYTFPSMTSRRPSIRLLGYFSTDKLWYKGIVKFKDSRA